MESLAERFGTPLVRLFRIHYSRTHAPAFEHAFRRVPHTVCYSVKANSSLGILRLLAGMGCGFDVVSGGELERVLRVDRRAAKKVVFSGVGKTAEEMQAALKAGVMLFNVESESELWRWPSAPRRTREKARIALRVNPDVPANTHPYISTGLQQHKFGIPISKARKLYAQASGTKYLESCRRQCAHRLPDHRRAALRAGHGTSGRTGERAARRRPPHSTTWMPAAAWASTTRMQSPEGFRANWPPNMRPRCCVPCGD